MKYTLLCFLGIAMSITVHAQDVQLMDASPAPKQKMFEHQVGVQINQLIRQVFNFSSSSSSSVNNPYLLVYSLTYRKLGIGLRFGGGYTYKSFTNDDGITKQETKINDYQFRLGLEKIFMLSKRWTAGVGADAVFTKNDDYTMTEVTSFDTTTTITNSKIPSSGAGAMAWLRYHITEKILIGTETSFYYTEGTQKQNISVTRRRNGNPGNPVETTISDIDNKAAEGIFALPVVFYLLVKF